MNEYALLIDKIWEDRSLLAAESNRAIIKKVIEALDAGLIRVAELINGNWVVNEWIKKAVILYFPISEMQTIHSGAFEFHDKIPLKNNFAELGVRVVPL